MADHLANKETNERVRMIELRGVVADDLKGALREMEAVASGTRSKRPLYHASVNTALNEPLTDEQWTHAIDQLEKKLGLTGQPRVVVEHEKAGREHRHVVWSRIDLEHMRAISDSHNYRKHEEVSRQLEQEFGHARVQGAHVGREGTERPERTPSHAEMQQAERTKLTPKQAKEQITAIWQRTDNGKAFAAGLEQEGWLLARGDRRDFVVLDPRGGTHSLAQRVDGAKTKDIRARMTDLDAATLPSVEQAREQQHARQVAREEVRDAAMPAPPTTPAPDPQQLRPEAEQRSSDTPEQEQATIRLYRGIGNNVGDAKAGDAVFFSTDQKHAADYGRLHYVDVTAAEMATFDDSYSTRDTDWRTADPAIIARLKPLEPDPPRGTTAAEGNVAVEGSAAPPAPAADVSEFVARGDADGMQAADQDSRAAETTTDKDAPASPDSSPVAAEPHVEEFDIAGGLARGAGVVLDVGAKLAEGVIGFLDGLIGGGDATAKTAAPSPDMTAKERHAARLQAFRAASQQHREAARQETAHSIGASEALTDDQLRHEKELQEKRHQDRFIENSR